MRRVMRCRGPRALARMAALGAVLAVFPLSVRAQAPEVAVLSLYSGEKESQPGFTAGKPLTGTSAIAASIGPILRERLHQPLYYFSEFVETARVGDPDYVTALVDLLRAKYEERRFNVILVIGDGAYSFLRQYRDDLFPGTPLVILTSEAIDAPPNSTGVVSGTNPGPALEIALTIQPDTQQVVVVAGTSPFDQYYLGAARDQFKPFEGRVSFTYLIGLPLGDLLQEVATLPARSIIFYLGMSEDREGRFLLPFEVASSLSAVANAPTYMTRADAMGLGIVGGLMEGGDATTRLVAARALRVLNGENPETILVGEPERRIVFDWRQLQRWNISESRLPANSTILFKEPGVWELYKAYIIGGALLLILQSALIAGLMVQGVRRRRTARALQQSYEQNKDLAGRLINAQEAERGRIARDLHDDLGQQLAVVGVMLGGLNRRLGGPGSEPEIDETLKTLQDCTTALFDSVRNLSHELHPRVLEHVGLVATLRRHCSDIERVHHLNVTFSAGDHLDTLSPDIALCLFRVTQETLTNAVRHGRARTIRVSLTTTADTVELHVVDDGVGFVAGERIGSGLGLRSIDERVRFLRGSVSVDSRPGEGTKVLVRIPISDARNPR